MSQNTQCLINQTACGRIQGDLVCPKCGMDERVVYPSEADRQAAQTEGRACYWEAHARQLEAAQPAKLGATVSEPAVHEPELPLPTSAEKLNPQAAWPFPTSKPSTTSTAAEPEITSVEDSADGALREKTLKRIRNGWICAVINVISVLMILVIGAVGPLDIDSSIVPYILIEVVMLVLLAGLVANKHRWGAAALFAYFLLSRITMSLDYGTPSPLILGAVFGYFYFMSMWGCFTWHKRFAGQAAWPFPTSRTP
jgi:hypothetical protein